MAADHSSAIMPPFPFQAPPNASDATQFDPKLTNGAMYISLAKSKHPEKALHISLLALAGTVQRLHIAHYATGGLLAPTAADIDVWIDGAGAGAARIEPDAELTTILPRLVAAVNASCQRCKITTAAEKTQHRLSLMIDANQLLTLSLIEGCSKHDLLRHVASLPAAVHNRNTFGFMSVQEVTGAEMLMMSFFDLYNSAFRAVQSRASFVAEAGVKIFDPPNLVSSFQEHKDNTRVQFDEFAAYVKTHSLDTTDKLLDHLHANKLVRFIHQAAKHPDMPTEARTIYGTTLDQIVQDLALKPSPATTERFDAIFTSLLTKLKTHGVSGTLSSAAGKTTHPFAKTALRQVTDEHHKRPERDLSRGEGAGRAGRQGRAAKTTGPKFKPGKATPGRKLPIADNNTVCESCDSHGHFARDCPHRKPNAVAAQKKRDAAWVERTQTRELKQIEKLNKEIQRLRVLGAASGAVMGSEGEDWETDEDTHAAKGAVNHKRYSLSSPHCVIPSRSYLLAATASHACTSDVRQEIAVHKRVHFPRVLSSAPPIDQHIDCAFLSCSCPKCATFKNSKGLWLLYGASNTPCQKRAGCKCAQISVSMKDRAQETCACEFYSQQR